ncbi:hypothetical protein IJ182_08930 [bacterium]|nr:hypothetical protein [bacterium]
MKISFSNNLYKPNFNARYNTEDVLRLVTAYNYRGKSSEKLVKSLTGIDLLSDEFKKTVPEDANLAIYSYTVQDICAKKAVSQYPILEEIRDKSTKELLSARTREDEDNWFIAKIQQIGKTINIKPFKISQDEIKSGYEEMLEVLRYGREYLSKNF